MTPSLSLSPRYDLFRFAFPKDWFPQDILDRYARMINENQSVILDPTDYINESISGISFPGISDLTISQQQTSTNSSKGKSQSLGHLKREPAHETSYLSPDNILTKIDPSFTVTMRRNQGLYNYFMMYETLMWYYDKRNTHKDLSDDLFKIYILDDTGNITAKVSLYQPTPKGIDGLDFSYDKVERQGDTFTVEFTFNNIDYKFLPNQEDINPE